MMKFLLCCCLFFTIAPIVKAASDTIQWRKERLQWSDFKAKADTAVHHKNYLANTACTITYFHRWNVRNGQVEVIAYAWFDGHHSWVKNSQYSNTALLLHEQGHFDLEEILARKFKKEIALTHFTKANYADSLQAIFNRLMTAMKDSQQQYDEDTIFGGKAAEQRRWQNYISETLVQLNDYAEKRVLSKE